MKVLNFLLTLTFLSISPLPLIGVENQEHPALDSLQITSLAKAKILKAEGNLPMAYKAMKTLEHRVSLDKWPAEHQHFFQELEQELNDYYAKELRHAELFFAASLYSEASVLYTQILTAIHTKLYPLVNNDREKRLELTHQIRYQLGLSYYLGKNYSQVIATFQEQIKFPSPKGPLAKEIYQQSFYLTALAYKQLNQYEQEIALLTTYLGFEDKSSLTHLNDAQQELGIAYFQLHQFDKARSYFKILADQTNPSSRLTYCAQLYLIKIDLAEEKYKNAEQALSKLFTSLPLDESLRYEAFYVQGQLFFHLENYAKAAEYFEKSIPQRNQEQALWLSETLYSLGWSYLRLAEDPLQNPSKQTDYFDKAEGNFKKLEELSPNEEKLALAFGHYYLSRGRHLKDENAFKQAEMHLARSEIFASKEAQVQSLLLRTEAASSYLERDKLYRQLTLDSLNESPLYAQGWYLRGLNDFEEGQNGLQGNRLIEANKAFKRAISALQKAFDLLRFQDPNRAGLALKYQAQALACLGTDESRLMALKILESLELEEKEIFAAMDDQDEIYYLQSLIASKIPQAPYQSMAINLLEKQLVLYPQGKFADDALYLLGILSFQNENYAKAKSHFLTLAADYPESTFAGSGYFWAANCAEKLKEEESMIKQYKRQVFEKYPHSSEAPEAYFTYFSYADYLQGDPAAIHHLECMPNLYPKSPYLLNVYYLIGLDSRRIRKSREGKLIHKRNLTAAIDAFHEVESTFDLLHQKELLPQADLNYFTTIRYRATLERALANLAIAEDSKGAKKQIYLEYAAGVFQQMSQEFENPDHPLAQLLTHQEPYPHLQEESDYGLARTFIKAKEDAQAEKILNTMIEKYQAAKITKGYFLSRAWYDRAQLAIHHTDYTLALKYLTESEDAAKGKILSTDEKLDLWIQQSLCLKSLNELDKAMLVLSKVINEDAISSLRLKAMYLRADIYAAQGRHELARKQLEATAKKGGQWALKAKDKLEKDYGYQ